jgi:uncharacterized protein with FMN-binding domain
MRRAPIVIAATVVGLIGVLEFHTKPATSGIAAIPASTAVGQAVKAGPAGSASARPRAASAAPPKPSSARKPTSASRTATTRTAAGPSVNYNWGVLSVSVTVTGTKITKVALASLDDGGNPRSQYIDQQSIPVLEQQAMQAQSANIQGVSGASYTSSGFQQSLQGALQKLGLA